MHEYIYLAFSFRIFTYHCSFCYWDSCSIGLSAPSQEELLTKIRKAAKDSEVSKEEMKKLLVEYESTMETKGELENKIRKERRSAQLELSNLPGILNEINSGLKPSDKDATILSSITNQRTHWTLADMEKKQKKITEGVNSTDLQFRCFQANCTSSFCPL